jgi:flavin reductase (DIM6/NTAB) family NADH-FMN oxidoreductase RutF
MTVTATPLGIDPHAFRGLLRQHASGVVVVTVPGAGFTATSFTSVSLRPQLVSFALDRSSSSWPAVERSSHAAIHLLRSDQRELARTFATSGVDRFAAVSWQPGPYGLRLLDRVLGLLVCEVAHRVEAGDHAIVLATPVRAEWGDGQPLLYHRGAYAELAP